MRELRKSINSGDLCQRSLCNKHPRLKVPSDLDQIAQHVGQHTPPRERRRCIAALNPRLSEKYMYARCVILCVFLRKLYALCGHQLHRVSSQMEINVFSPDGVCCICHESLLERGRQTRPCRHVMHEDCVRKMRRFGASDKCPLCREAFLFSGPSCFGVGRQAKRYLGCHP